MNETGCAPLLEYTRFQENGNLSASDEKISRLLRKRNSGLPIPEAKRGIRDVGTTGCHEEKKTKENPGVYLAHRGLSY